MTSVTSKYRKQYINTNIKVCVLNCILAKRGNSINLNTYLQNVQQGIYVLRERTDISNKQELFDNGIIPDSNISSLNEIKRHAYCMSKTINNYRAHILKTKEGIQLPRLIPQTWNGLLISDLDFKYIEKHFDINLNKIIKHVNIYLSTKIQQDNNIFNNNLICSGISLSRKGIHIYWGIENMPQLTDNTLRNLIYKSKTNEIFFEINNMLEFILKEKFHLSINDIYTCKLAINDPSAILHTQLLMREYPGSLRFNIHYKGLYNYENFTEEDIKIINSSFMYIYNLRGKHNNIDKENPLTLLDTNSGILTPTDKKDDNIHDFLFDKDTPYYNTDTQIRENLTYRNKINKYKLYIDPHNLKKILETPNRKIPHLFYEDRWKVLNIFRLCCNIDHPVKLYHTLFSDGIIFDKGDEIMLMNNIPIRHPNFFINKKYITYINNIFNSKLICIDFKDIIIPGCISVVNSKYNPKLSYFNRNIIHKEICFWLSEYRKQYITKSKINTIPITFISRKNMSSWNIQKDSITCYKTKYTARCYNPHFCENLFNALREDDNLYMSLKQLDSISVLNMCAKYLSKKDLSDNDIDFDTMKDINDFYNKQDYINKSKNIITGLLYRTYDFIATTAISIKCNIHDMYLALTKLKIKNKEIYDRISNSLNRELDILQQSKKIKLLYRYILPQSSYI